MSFKQVLGPEMWWKHSKTHKSNHKSILGKQHHIVFISERLNRIKPNKMYHYLVTFYLILEYKNIYMRISANLHAPIYLIQWYITLFVSVALCKRGCTAKYGVDTYLLHIFTIFSADFSASKTEREGVITHALLLINLLQTPK